MPLPITLALCFAAIAIGLVGPALVVYLLTGLAVGNELLRFVVLRGIPTQGAPAEYQIPARPDPRVRGDDGG